MQQIAKFLVVMCIIAVGIACLVLSIGTDEPIDTSTPEVTKSLEDSTESESTTPEEEIPDVEVESSEESAEEPDETKETKEEPEEPEEEETVTPVYNYTEEELDLLARLIYSESGIESYQTQLMVGSVVMNRVDSSHFPNTIREVIYQKNQFSVTFVMKDGVPMIDHPADEEAKRSAYEVLTYGSILPPEVQVFYLTGITTGWVATREPYGTFDHTTFAYIYEKGSK